jgi:glycolate oxidase
MSVLHDERIDGQLPRPEPEPLIGELAEICGREAVLSDAESLAVYECDGLSAYRSRPLVAVLPGSTDEVEQILRLCSRLGVAVVTRGAGTGLSGGALPVPGAVLLVLTRLNRIIEIDPDNATATVQPGVANLAISRAAQPHGLYYAPDPSSQVACSIGGNVAENAGGVHCLKYGLTVNNVLGLELITMAGETIRLGGKRLDDAGPDLLALMHGSEGMLGVITEVTLRLLPMPEETIVILAAFGDVASAGSAVHAVLAAGIIPSGLEMMDRAAIEAVQAHSGTDYPAEADAVLLCEVDGNRSECEQAAERVQALFERCGAVSQRRATSASQRAALWAGRKNAFPAVGRISPDYYCMDGTIPRERIADVLERIAALASEAGLRVANVFHAGDGNLHPLILYNAAIDGQLEAAEALGGKILEVCLEAGGTITGEHGVGREKIDQMCLQFGESELSLFHAIKASFDPAGLLNPGKAVPTLARCAEFGRMHVHAGHLAHPDLPRF